MGCILGAGSELYWKVERRERDSGMEAAVSEQRVGGGSLDRPFLNSKQQRNDKLREHFESLPFSDHDTDSLVPLFRSDLAYLVNNSYSLFRILPRDSQREQSPDPPANDAPNMYTNQNKALNGKRTKFVIDKNSKELQPNPPSQARDGAGIVYN